ncbi:energy-coupled thiamine transporter ThiT [Clostridium cochlearium]|jgi:thiamine transporter|uniref:Thiamine transporter n=1 Tax=Clostridium cochlearium TaxID=1494 RepID=A0A1G9IQ32_CLOCO|nr:energy-coupled thiamine transporter ThiT [Clostridium cochlearium]MBV1820383.1 energy-coupled thiamine transporter ThiT [Bacteroidales bacterium MSK.15.36]NSJ91721.1 energy-coupled thiamine transporter ThiT [Coprococcus sp. MSK.21.13]MBE6065819.1 energy-coupled thiamine transporter ThiT [Clostridium cochlearium]MBU5269960.1 energy-coupled thiamine transporter ThiT [Clostridium cochlearium]MCG4572614.1 energy-coupled thiamine transporter ThiT [Clostridium cochlearium]
MNLLSLGENLLEIVSNPNSILTLLGLMLVVIILLKSKKIKLTPALICSIGLALALATILDMFKLTKLPNGGSVTLGAMVPIILMALLYGPEVGFLTGFLYGLIKLILGPYILHPLQVLFDYPLPFMALGLAGYFKNNKILGTIMAILGRFVFHFIAGVVFWGSTAPESMSPYLYSLIYNGSFLSVNALICIVIIYVLPIENIYKIINKKSYYKVL